MGDCRRERAERPCGMFGCERAEHAARVRSLIGSRRWVDAAEKARVRLGDFPCYPPSAQRLVFGAVPCSEQPGNALGFLQPFVEIPIPLHVRPHADRLLRRALFVHAAAAGQCLQAPGDGLAGCPSSKAMVPYASDGEPEGANWKPTMAGARPYRNRNRPGGGWCEGDRAGGFKLSGGQCDHGETTGPIRRRRAAREPSSPLPARGRPHASPLPAPVARRWHVSTASGSDCETVARTCRLLFICETIACMNTIVSPACALSETKASMHAIVSLSGGRLSTERNKCVHAHDRLAGGRSK